MSEFTTRDADLWRNVAPPDDPEVRAALARERPRIDRELLAVVTFGAYARTLGATTGPFGLLFWQLIASNSRTGINRVIDAQRHVLGDPTKSKATTAAEQLRAEKEASKEALVKRRIAEDAAGTLQAERDAAVRESQRQAPARAR